MASPQSIGLTKGSEQAFCMHQAIPDSDCGENLFIVLGIVRLSSICLCRLEVVRDASAPVLILNNTIVENKLLLAAGAPSQGSQFFASQQMERIYLINNLIIGSGSQSAIDCFQSSPTQPVQPPTFDNNDVYNFKGASASADSGACADQTGAVGNISADPLFSSGVGDVNPFQLTLSSPAVDAGDNLAPGLPALDVLGQPRIQNAKGLSSSIVDMGAYEFRGVLAPPSPAPDLTVTASPSSLTVVQGQSGRVSVTVTPTSGSLGTVLLTCSGLPASASCTLSPSLMNFTTTSPQSSTLTISAGMASANLSRVPSPNSSHSMVLAGLFLIPTLFAGKRRSSDTVVQWMLSIGAICAVSLCTGLSGCGKDQYIILAAPETYQVTVQGSAPNSGISRQTSVTLVVTQ
jgi:hypothetical protein